MLDKAQAQAEWEAAVTERAAKEARLSELTAQAAQVRADADARLAGINAEAATINETLPDLLAAEQAAYENLRVAQEEQATGIPGGVPGARTSSMGPCP